MPKATFAPISITLSNFPPNCLNGLVALWEKQKSNYENKHAQKKRKEVQWESAINVQSSF